jgi:hypothetical protein
MCSGALALSRFAPRSRSVSGGRGDTQISAQAVTAVLTVTGFPMGTTMDLTRAMEVTVVMVVTEIPDWGGLGSPNNRWRGP